MPITRGEGNRHVKPHLPRDSVAALFERVAPGAGNLA